MVERRLDVLDVGRGTSESDAKEVSIERGGVCVCVFWIVDSGEYVLAFSLRWIPRGRSDLEAWPV